MAPDLQLARVATHSVNAQWRGWFFGGLLLLWGVSFYPTLLGMVTIWYQIETFAHCFFIIPISVYLIWQRRSELRMTPLASEPSVLLLLVGLLGLWALAGRLGVQVLEQFSVLAMLPCLVWLSFGRQVCRVILFPLLFVFFALPFGEFLIPQLQQITASMTVNLLRLSGVPVYQEGMFLFIPEARFEVAWTCSGIRYLLAAVSLGCLFSYLHFSRYYKRSLFIGLAIILPVVANGLRAWSIIMIYHFIDQRIAGDIDHLIYGWLFFSLLISVLFFVGWWFADPARPALIQDCVIAPLKSSSLLKQIMPLCITALMFVWVWLAVDTERTAPLTLTAKSLPLGEQGWQGPVTARFSPWQAQFPDADLQWQQQYQRQAESLIVFSAYYQDEHQGKELISAVNHLYDAKQWQLQGQDTVDFTINDAAVSARRLKLANHNQQISVFYWYQVGPYHALGALATKWYQWLNAPLGESTGQVVAIAVERQGDHQRVLDFLTAHQVSWQQWLAHPVVYPSVFPVGKEPFNDNGNDNEQ